VTELVAFEEAAGRVVVAVTDQAFTGVTSNRAVARRVRLSVVPLLIPLFFSFAGARRLVILLA